ncbi:SDR family oxidoreductase [Marisediminicola sp. LYQ134]|uniref:SDR family oxidoreductase n=1 Tax=Marisediminicola sp. LYQ134 TaxID=3391061 RepID=UPI0039835F0E
MTTKSLQGRIIAITGASSGIGEQTAIELARRGAAVVLAARRTDRIDAVAATIRTDGGRAIAVPTDVTDVGDVRALVAAAVAEFGQLDALVNNAGIARLGPLELGDTDDWAAMIDVNVHGLLNALAAALPIFRQQGHGHIVTIASTAGITVSPSMAVYAASKNAARTIMEGLRAESTDGVIKTTSISPGFVQTELADGMAPEAREEIQAGMRSFGLDPQAVANAVGFVLEQPADVEIGDLTIRPTVQG